MELPSKAIKISFSLALSPQSASLPWWWSYFSQWCLRIKLRGHSLHFSGTWKKPSGLLLLPSEPFSVMRRKRNLFRFALVAINGSKREALLYPGLLHLLNSEYSSKQTHWGHWSFPWGKGSLLWLLLWPCRIQQWPFQCRCTAWCQSSIVC